MGWRGRKGRKGKRSRDDAPTGDSPPNKMRKDTRKGYTPIKRENEEFSHYYKNLGIIPEEEWEEFQQTIVRDLPTTFRVSPIGIFHELAQKKLQEFTKNIKGDDVIDGQVLEPPRPLHWYPNDGAWHINAGRGPVRNHPKYKEFHKFLVAFTEFGGITRQEAVSMIPPLLLDVEENHVVLDMCAAPGSKTSQIVEIMHTKAGNVVPKGVVIANDLDEKRCYMMIHQVNRLSSPCVIATQHMAQKFPYVRLNDNQGDEKHPDLVFDRILADVPCTGDGTLRKNFDLWQKWNCGMGNGIHKIQVQIATRGVKLLKIGGRMVYSTCSLNPVEDEAVVAEILRRAKGTIELVDVSKELPELKRSNGINKWPVRLKEQFYTSFDELTDQYLKDTTAPSLFPPTEEEAKVFHLERCMRILPHHQNTGGFFVAVLKKTGSIPVFFGETSREKAQRIRVEKQMQNDSSNSNPNPKPEESKPIKEETKLEEPTQVKKEEKEDSPTANKEKKGNADIPVKHSKEDPFMFCEGERWDKSIGNIKDFYGLDDTFRKDLLMIRSEGTCPRIYLLTEAAQKILSFEENKCLRIVNMGLRVFGKHSFKDASCPYRINSEGLVPLVPSANEKRCIKLTLNDLRILLENDHPFFITFSQPAQALFEPMEIGGLWFSVDLSEYGLERPLYLSGWRGKVSSHLLSASSEKRMLKYLFIEDSS